jgi:peptide/nickel transport system permease protein
VEKLSLSLKVLRKTGRAFSKNRLGMIGVILLLIFVSMAVLAKPLYAVGWIQDPNNVMESSSSETLKPPSQSHLIGTDDKGRDIMSQLFFGAKNSLVVGFAAALLTMAFGAAIGLIAGAFGRATDEFLMRFTDLFLVIPWLPFAVILASFLPPINQPSMYKIIIVIGLTSWPPAARIVRSQVLSIRERSFIERAISVGAGKLHIIRRHLLPNVFPLVFANAILSVSNAILSEAFLSFFGIGDPTRITWGMMLYNGYNFGGFASRAYWFIVPPGLCIVLVVLGFTFISYALDDVLNPKLRGR